MSSIPPDSFIRRRPRTRLVISEPALGQDGRWICTGKILGHEYAHLPWLGEGERPSLDEDGDAPTATLFLVAGAGATPEEAQRQVLSKIKNVWGTDSTPPPAPRIEEAEERDFSLVRRLWQKLRRSVG